MVVLVTNDVNQMNILEWELITNRIDYRLNHRNLFGLEPPYLIVNGVPIDFERSMIWIKEHSNG